MRKFGKKAFTGIFKLAAFALAAILLFFLIKNQWNAGNAFKGMIGLFGL